MAEAQVLEEQEASGHFEKLTKKESALAKKELEKLRKYLSGVKNMTKRPDVIIVIDQKREMNAIKEALKLKIPIISILDTNCDPDLVDIPIPGNDDALRAISLYCDLVAASVLKGLESNLEQSGVDIGESEVIVEENTSQNINSDNIPEVVSADPVILDSDNPENVVKD